MVIIIYQHGFILGNEWTTLVGDADNGGGCAGTGGEGIWEISVFSSQFYSKPKIALKN